MMRSWRGRPMIQAKTRCSQRSRIKSSSQQEEEMHLSYLHPVERRRSCSRTCLTNNRQSSHLWVKLKSRQIANQLSSKMKMLSPSKYQSLLNLKMIERVFFLRTQEANLNKETLSNWQLLRTVKQSCLLRVLINVNRERKELVSTRRQIRDHLLRNQMNTKEISLKSRNQPQSLHLTTQQRVLERTLS
jgi:hypothetical protein